MIDKWIIFWIGVDAEALVVNLKIEPLNSSLATKGFATFYVFF